MLEHPVQMEGDGEQYVTRSLNFSITYYKTFNTANTNACHWTQQLTNTI